MHRFEPIPHTFDCAVRRTPVRRPAPGQTSPVPFRSSPSCPPSRVDAPLPPRAAGASGDIQPRSGKRADAQNGRSESSGPG